MFSRASFEERVSQEGSFRERLGARELWSMAVLLKAIKIWPVDSGGDRQTLP